MQKNLPIPIHVGLQKIIVIFIFLFTSEPDYATGGLSVE